MFVCISTSLQQLTEEQNEVRFAAVCRAPALLRFRGVCCFLAAAEKVEAAAQQPTAAAPVQPPPAAAAKAPEEPLFVACRFFDRECTGYIEGRTWKRSSSWSPMQSPVSAHSCSSWMHSSHNQETAGTEPASDGCIEHSATWESAVQKEEQELCLDLRGSLRSRR